MFQCFKVQPILLVWMNLDRGFKVLSYKLYQGCNVVTPAVQASVLKKYGAD